jgi:hypothetical protein
MDTQVRNAVVESYQPLIASLALPDPNDRQVLSGCPADGRSNSHY